MPTQYTFSCENAVTLQSLQIDDAEQLHELVSCNQTHLNRDELDKIADKLKTVADVEKYIQRSSAENIQLFGILKTEVLAGVLVVTPIANESVVHIGYWIGEQFTRQGTATTAVKKIVHYYRHRNEFKHMIALTRTRNGPSKRVLIKAGFEEAYRVKKTIHFHQNIECTPPSV